MDSTEFEQSLFLTDLDDNLLCSICAAVLDCPVLTPCGHAFCRACLSAWLTGSASCPHCRSLVLPGDARPILCLRGLIGGLPVRCPNFARGCQHTGRLDGLERHRAACSFAASTDDDDDDVDDNSDSTDSATGAEQPLAMERAVQTEEPPPPQASQQPSQQTHPMMASGGRASLRADLARLQWELTVARRDAAAAEARARALDRELKISRSELEQQRRHSASAAAAAVAAVSSAAPQAEFDLDYEYGFAPQSIARLSQFIARHLRRRPHYVSAERAFNSVKRCYDNYARGNPSSEYLAEVHMLVATANASDWFSESQRITLQLWLQSLGRHHKSASTGTGAGGSGNYRYYVF